MLSEQVRFAVAITHPIRDDLSLMAVTNPADQRPFLPFDHILWTTGRTGFEILYRATGADRATAKA
jgi:hypothetical protein